MSLFILLCAILLLVLLINYYAAYFRYKGVLNSFPGPLVIPLFGNAFSFGYELTEIFKCLHYFHERYGNIVRLWPIYLVPVILTNDADLIGTLLSSTRWIDKARDYKYFEPWLRKGLLTSTGEKWHKRRKLITPAFHFQILEQFAKTFSREADKLTEIFGEHVGQNSVDIYPLINKCALDVICKTAMGTNLETQSGKNLGYLRAVKEMLRIIGVRSFSIVKCFDTGFQMTLDYFRMKETLKALHSFTHTVISERRKVLMEDETSDQETPGLYRRKVAFLDLLIKGKVDGLPLTDEEIQEEVDTFLFEGFDTVTSGLSFTLYALSKHPDVQEKILEEIKSVLGEDFDETFTLEKIQKLNYLGQVVKEGLRLYPPVAIFQRQIKEEFKVGKHSFPVGTIFVVNAFNLHRREEHFSNPDKFDPDRFDDRVKSDTERHPFCYLPFSGGPRNCIGQRFAMNEMKIAIAKIVMKFKLLPAEPKHELVLFTDGILKSKTGIHLKLERRQL